MLYPPFSAIAGFQVFYPSSPVISGFLNSIIHSLERLLTSTFQVMDLRTGSIYHFHSNSVLDAKKPRITAEASVLPPDAILVPLALPTSAAAADTKQTTPLQQRGASAKQLPSPLQTPQSPASSSPRRSASKSVTTAQLQSPLGSPKSREAEPTAVIPQATPAPVDESEYLYRVMVVTSDVENAGTDADASIVLQGGAGSSGEMPLSSKREQNFQQGQVRRSENKIDNTM